MQVLATMVLSSQGSRNTGYKRLNGFATTVKLVLLLVIASQATPK